MCDIYAERKRLVKIISTFLAEKSLEENEF